MSFFKSTEEEIKQPGINIKIEDLGEGSQLNADSTLSRSLPSTSGTISIALKRSSSASSFIEKGLERGLGAIDVAYGNKKAVELDSLDAYEKRITVLLEVIKKIAGKNERIENLLKNRESVVEDFLKAFQKKPSQSKGEDIKEIIEKIIQLEKLENEIGKLENEIKEKNSQVETLKNRLGLINQRREEEKEDRKELENEIVDLEENLRKVKQEHEEIVRELEREIKMLEEMLEETEEVYNDIINDLEENERELQKDLKLKTSEINTLVDDKEELTVTILDTADACALFYKEKMLNWLESDLKKTGDNLVNKFNCLKQLFEPNRETKTGKRWQNLFNSFDAYYQNLENFLSEERQEKENQIESRLKVLKEQENELLNRKSQLEQEVETLEQKIETLQQQISEKDILLKSIASVKLEELVKKIELLKKELVDKTEEKRSIEERLTKIKEEQKEVIDKKKDLSNKHQKNQENRNKRREKRWNRRISGPEMMKKDKEMEKEETLETRTISRQITDNNLKGKELQKEQTDLDERLIKSYRKNEENYLQNISELKTELEEKNNLVGLCSQLYALEKQLDSAKLKISDGKLQDLLDVYKAEDSPKAKEKLNKELSEEELEAILHEDDVRRKIEEIKQQLKGKIDLPPNTD